MQECRAWGSGFPEGGGRKWRRRRGALQALRERGRGARFPFAPLAPHSLHPPIPRGAGITSVLSRSWERSFGSPVTCVAGSYVHLHPPATGSPSVGGTPNAWGWGEWMRKKGCWGLLETADHSRSGPRALPQAPSSGECIGNFAHTPLWFRGCQ